MKKPLQRASGRSGSGKLGLAGLGGMLLVGFLGACAANARPSAAPPSTTPSTSALPKVLGRIDEARALSAAGKLPEATSTLERAMTECRALRPAAPRTLALVLGDLSSALVQQQQHARARSLLAEALTLVPPGTFEDDQRIYQLQMVLAESYRYEQQPAQAVAHFEQAVSATARHEDQLASEQVEALDRLAKTLDALNREAEANQAWMRAYAVAMRTPALRLRAVSLAGPALFRREGLEALRQRGGFARRRLRDASAAVDIPLEEGVSFEPVGSVAPTAPRPPTPQSTPVSPTVSNAAHVVAGMRAGFRTCYQRSLTEDKNSQGNVRLLLKVGSGGEVLIVQALALGLPASCVDCILERAIAGQFDPPEGGSAVIAVPVTFVKQ